MFNKMQTAASEWMNNIHHHPFNQELAHGILPKEKFMHYLQQDVMYLGDFSRALALTGARLVDNDHAQQFMQFALGAIKAERDLHFGYLQGQLPLNITQAPACFMYTNYLLRMASTASVEEAAASLLPCFWVYREVGKKIAKTAKIDNPYHNWIQVYSSDSFDESVQSAIQIINQLGNQASDDIKNKMLTAFLKSTQLEWYFWESAYRLEHWFVPAQIEFV